jgi:hypothetical protein
LGRLARSTPLRAQLIGLLGLAAGSAGAVPLDLEDASSRSILVESFGVTVPAGYAVSGGMGIVTISATDHELLRPHSLDPVPGSFTPLVLRIDLGDGSATSDQASGAWETPPQSESFTQGPLSTEAAAGYVQSPDLPALFCESQQQVNELCLIEPLFCGATCVIVPGSRYDGNTGHVLLVGGEERIGCDGGVCFGPLTFFSQLQPVLSEDPTAKVVPSLHFGGRAALAAALLLLGMLSAARRSA